MYRSKFHPKNILEEQLFTSYKQLAQLYQVDFLQYDKPLLEAKKEDEIHTIQKQLSHKLLTHIHALNTKHKNQFGADDIFCRLSIQNQSSNVAMLPNVACNASSFAVNRSEKEMNKITVLSRLLSACNALLDTFERTFKRLHEMVILRTAWKRHREYFAHQRHLAYPILDFVCLMFSIAHMELYKYVEAIETTTTTKQCIFTWTQCVRVNVNTTNGYNSDNEDMHEIMILWQSCQSCYANVNKNNWTRILDILHTLLQIDMPIKSLSTKEKLSYQCDLTRFIQTTLQIGKKCVSGLS